jgi:protein-disulfide isomerase
LSNEKLVSIGKKIGITSTTFADSVTKESKLDLVKANYDSMQKFGVNGTPTVFINGKLWERKSPDFNLAEFKAAVEAA